MYRSNSSSPAYFECLIVPEWAKNYGICNSNDAQAQFEKYYKNRLDKPSNMWSTHVRAVYYYNRKKDYDKRTPFVSLEQALKIDDTFFQKVLEVLNTINTDLF